MGFQVISQEINKVHCMPMVHSRGPLSAVVIGESGKLDCFDMLIHKDPRNSRIRRCEVNARYSLVKGERIVRQQS